MSRVVEIAEHGRHLSVDRGFLLARADGKDVGHVALDDVSALLIVGHGCTYSAELTIALAERGAIVVVCGRGYLPVAWTLPVVGHHAQTRIATAQAEASKALNRRLWQRIMRAKIRAQADALEFAGKERGILDALVAQVGPGDEANVEATAAQRYWPTLFGPLFRRAREQSGINALLNYGYTVVRSAVARATVAAGLHPSVSVRHRRDPMALVDDLMEPFRGAIDRCVVGLVATGTTDIDPRSPDRGRAAREALVDVLDARTADGTVSTSIGAFVRWVAEAYVSGSLPAWTGGIHVATRSVRPANGNGGRTQGLYEVSQCASGPRLREDAMVGLRAQEGVAGIDSDVEPAGGASLAGKGSRDDAAGDR